MSNAHKHENGAGSHDPAPIFLTSTCSSSDVSAPSASGTPFHSALAPRRLTANYWPQSQITLLGLPLREGHTLGGELLCPRIGSLRAFDIALLGGGLSRADRLMDRHKLIGARPDEVGTSHGFQRLT